MTHAPNRRWFQWSLRTLFVVVTVFGCWLGYEMNWIRQRHAALASGKASGDDPFGKPYTAEPPGLLWLFGEPGYPQLVLRISPLADGQFEPIGADAAELERLKGIFPESVIDCCWEEPPRRPKRPRDIDGFKVL